MVVLGCFWGVEGVVCEWRMDGVYDILEWFWFMKGGIVGVFFSKAIYGSCW